MDSYETTEETAPARTAAPDTDREASAAASDPTVPRRTRLSREERMEQTLRVAHDLFAEHGYLAVTMDEVAAAVGVTKPLLYNYFGNKERLFLACLEQAGEQLESRVVDAVSSTSNPSEALRVGLRAFFAFVDEERETWRVLYDEAIPAESEISRKVAEYRGRITGLVATVVAAQLPDHRGKRAAIEVEALSTALLGAAESMAHWLLRTESLTAEQAAELLIETVEPGLSARTEN